MGREKTIQTDISGVEAYLQPPENFDPERASNADLHEHGFPSRPDREKDRASYMLWKRLTSAKRTRIVPKLSQTCIRHGPASILSERQVTPGTIAAQSNNWSGFAIVAPPNTFNTGASHLSAVFTCPQATGVAMGAGEYHSSQWIGLDGYGSNDVLQCGTCADLVNPGGVSVNYAWFEWFPNYEIKIDNLPVSFFDRINAAVYIIDPSGHGPVQYHISLENERTLKSVDLRLYPPNGTSLIGDTAEWIIERPGVNGQLSLLSRYIDGDAPWQPCIAIAPGHGGCYPGYTPVGTIYDITMIENSVPVSQARLAPPEEPGGFSTDLIFSCFLPVRTEAIAEGGGSTAGNPAKG